MNAKEQIFQEIKTLRVEKNVYGGYGLSHLRISKGGQEIVRPVFVPNVIENELVEVQIKGKKKKVLWAELLDVIEEDQSQRIKAKCQHSLACGGCSYQHISYENQLKIKEDILREIYQGELELGSTISSPNRFNYRNKCEFSFGQEESGELQLGLHPPGKFFEVMDLQECFLLPQKMWNVLQKIKKLANNSGLGAFKDLKKIGFWSTITVRYSSSNDGMLLIFKVANPEELKLKEISTQLVREFPQVLGVLALPAPRGELVQIAGINTISQRINNVELVYQAENFFQINTFILPLLMERVVHFVRQANIDIVYDLFGGVGTLGIYIAKQLPHIQKVIGAESDEKACKMASFNAELNSLDNYESNFLNLYKRGWGKALKQEKKKACAIIDPPRAGMSQKSIKDIGELNPQSIVYVSCNPVTQKRDIDLLSDFGYRIQSLQLIDMFPQTYHLESIAFLEK
ncbi:MAG: 23S rRNA (uracil(1939)-C(5))-methyltransferase RlmD [Candidatus Caenarcaniphilales bacterium]|nr:23S rRNA (uracil(1939)-C(5))-methyltransferase RlmD [Candidatus Caenarcaniphilales bacterium]